MQKIYTRTGDRGETSLFGGKRVLKSHKRVETYGTVDELNSELGAVIAHLKTSDKQIKKQLEQVQHDLFEIGANLANPQPKPLPWLAGRVTDFERIMDQLAEKLPELHNFILPGGSKAGSLLHVARTVCRRTERNIVALAQTEEIDVTIQKYLNRLSDLLFTLARFFNQKERKKETIWKKRDL